jgi:hypothetical protein
MRKTLLALVALLALLPGASAHISGFSQAKSLEMGPYAVYIQPNPSDVYANNTISFSALVSDNATGNYVTNPSASMALQGPGNWSKSKDLVKDPSGYLIGAFVLPEAGNYSATFILHAGGQDYTSSTTFTAYPDLPVRIQSADVSQDITVGAVTKLAIETVDPITLGRVDKITDLEMNIERWSSDHSIMYEQHEVSLNHTGKGTWTVEYAFPQASMYHLRFASRSGGFNYDSVPILHLYATDPTPADPGPGKKLLPGPGPVALLAAVGVAAWAFRSRR